MDVMTRFIHCLLVTGFLWGSGAFGAEPRTVRLLTIGNSFSRNATNHLDELAEAGGHRLIHTAIVVGGASLQLHAEKAQAHEADAGDAKGRYANGRSLKEELGAEAWDFVTIQQASIKSHDPATYQPHAGWLAGYIARHAPTAKLLVHQTWAYRKDDPRFTRPAGAPGEPATQEAMYEGLRRAYDEVAAALGARVIPVGDAFFTADNDAKWGYKPEAGFDPKTAKGAEPPAQTHSLHVGWRRAKPRGGGEATLGMDGHHANLAGEYLGACVWYEVLFGESVTGIDYVPEGMDAGHARFLRETAHGAVRARQAKGAAAGD
jgi:hypothetical protein